MDLCRIWTRIDVVEGDDADHTITTTAQYYFQSQQQAKIQKSFENVRKLTLCQPMLTNFLITLSVNRSMLKGKETVSEFWSDLLKCSLVTSWPLPVPGIRLVMTNQKCFEATAFLILTSGSGLERRGGGVTAAQKSVMLLGVAAFLCDDDGWR